MSRTACTSVVHAIGGRCRVRAYTASRQTAEIQGAPIHAELVSALSTEIDGRAWVLCIKKLYQTHLCYFTFYISCISYF